MTNQKLAATLKKMGFSRSINSWEKSTFTKSFKTLDTDFQISTRLTVVVTIKSDFWADSNNAWIIDTVGVKSVGMDNKFRDVVGTALINDESMANLANTLNELSALKASK